MKWYTTEDVQFIFLEFYYKEMDFLRIALLYNIIKILLRIIYIFLKQTRAVLFKNYFKYFVIFILFTDSK